MKRLFTFLLVCMLVGDAFGQTNVIDDRLQNVLTQSDDNVKISVNIILKSQMDSDDLKAQTRNAANRKERQATTVEELKKYSEKSQRDVLSLLKVEERNNSAAEIRCHWLVNAISCVTTKEVIYQLSSHPDVAAITYDEP